MKKQISQHTKRFVTLLFHIGCGEVTPEKLEKAIGLYGFSSEEADELRRRLKDRMSLGV